TAGFLDPTFGSDPLLPGSVVTDFGITSQAQSVALQADGKILAAGAVATNGITPASDFALARYNQDGSLDDGGPNDTTPGDSFGSKGKVQTDFLGGIDTVLSVVVQTDGKIVAAGIANDFTDQHAVLARYNVDGTLDDGGPNDSTPGDSFGT